MTIQSKIALIAPDFSNLDNLNDFIDLADKLVGKKVCHRDLAVAYLSAHLIELSKRGGSASGAITSESEGQLRRSYGAASESLLSATPYGLEYLRILRNCGLGSYTMRTFL